ncbi:centromere protein M isoform X1 [Lepisosteus oculatus]|uniref:centromere protein M isoform X1 n=1 Tax=Lepisosteus oculatus TaxID=7918 RepID=UPI0035F509B7
MSAPRPFSKLPELNTANVLLVENEMSLQKKLAEAILQENRDCTVNVRLARCLPLPVENEESRPRIDLLVFIVNLRSEQSLSAAESSVRHMEPGYCLGKACFLATEARCDLVPPERLSSLMRLAASCHCPLLFAEAQTAEGVKVAAQRLLRVLKVSAGLIPGTTGLYMSTLTRSIVPADRLADTPADWLSS